MSPRSATTASCLRRQRRLLRPRTDNRVAKPEGFAHLRGMTDQLAQIIDEAWENRDRIDAATGGPIRAAVEAALDGLDAGRFRVAEKRDGEWHTHQWLKKAVLLSFRLSA